MLVCGSILRRCVAVVVCECAVTFSWIGKEERVSSSTWNLKLSLGATLFFTWQVRHDAPSGFTFSQVQASEHACLSGCALRKAQYQLRISGYHIWDDIWDDMTPIDMVATCALTLLIESPRSRTATAPAIRALSVPVYRDFFRLEAARLPLTAWPEIGHSTDAFWTASRIFLSWSMLVLDVVSGSEACSRP